MTNRGTRINNVINIVLLVVAALVVAAALDKWSGDEADEVVESTTRGAATITPAAEIDLDSVPEMVEIMSDDQTTRRLATRRLAERVGVEQALEIVEASDLPHTGEGHLAVHEIGFYAYRTYGVEAILHCKDYFLYACYHGTIIEAASDEGLETVAKMADKCKGSAGRYFQCAHATGHSLLAMWNYDLPEALSDCDEIFEPETDFQGALSSCHNGAFMENLFGVHDFETGKEIPRDWLRDDDPYFPCNAFEDKYQKGCWLNQAARIYTVMGGDVVKTRESCEQTGNSQYTEWCMNNLARQIHPMTLGQVDKVYELCQQVGNYWYENCIVVNSGSYYSVGDPATSIEVCTGRLSPRAKSDCYEKAMGQLMADINLDAEAKINFCGGMEPGWREECVRRMQS